MRVLWLLPRRPAGVPSGGDLYDSLIVAGLRRLGHHVEMRDSLPAASRVRADVVVQDELGFERFLPFNRELDRARCSARRVALVHVTTARLNPARQTASLEARYLASTHAAVFVSHQARAESLKLLSLRRQKTAVVSPGADRLPARRKASGDGSLRLLCVAHLLPQKGQLALLNAFESSGLDATLTLVGAGSLDRRYTSQIVTRLASMPRARWLGPLGRAGLARALSRADVFINASDYESWGMAAAEAQAEGLPVLSWSRGGLWEFLTPGTDALRARAASPTALARLRDRALILRLSAGAGRARVRSWAQAAKEFARVLEHEVKAR